MRSPTWTKNRTKDRTSRNPGPDALGQGRELAGELPATPLSRSVQVRYRHGGEPAKARTQADGSLAVTLDRPTKAITPGQAAVFYDGERVLGRGWLAAPA
ncbi:MAG TPA: aminomethyltransferase beta-barrel domain-containing protein [Polyangia bacterium]